jgi:hypothetical protein
MDLGLVAAQHFAMTALRYALALVAVCLCTVACGGDPTSSSTSASATHSSSVRSQSPAGDDTTPQCSRRQPSRTADSTKVYFYCVNRLVPVYRHIPSGDQALSYLVANSLQGPTQSELAAGYIGGVLGHPKFIITVDEHAVHVDVVPSSIPVDRVVDSAFSFPKPLQRTLSEFTGGKRITVTVGGKTFCQLSEECSG